MHGRQSRSEFLTLMAAASATIAAAIAAVLPAFAAVREDFGLEPTSPDVALIVTVFIAGLGVGQVVYGPLADRFGRKPVFMLGVALYVVAGLATALAPSLGLLLIGRFFWGLGAAGPRVVAQAMLRDRFVGDELARAMAVILTIFLIAPTVAPAFGQAILQLGSWRYTFAIGPVFGTLVALWATRVDETLDSSRRRALTGRSVLRAFAGVLRTRSALGNTIALTMMMAAFLPYIASSERMYTEIYGRGSQFFLWFASTAVAMALFTIVTSRFVDRYGAQRTARAVFGLLIFVAIANLAGTIGADGVPGFGFFFIATTLLVALNTAVTPIITSRALHDVGHIAGTAASTIGAISFIGGSLLSPLVDNAISATVTPFAAGYLIFAVFAAAAAGLGEPSSPDHAVVRTALPPTID